MGRRLRFNPSSTPQTNAIFTTMLGLAGEEYKLQRKKTQFAETLKSLKEGGLFGEQPTSGTDPSTRGLIGSMGAHVSGIDLETGEPKLSFMSPKDRMEMKLMSEIGDSPGYRRESVSAGGQTFKRIPTLEEEDMGIQKKVREEEATSAAKPLSDMSATRYSGALQSIRGIKRISDILELDDIEKAGSKDTRNLIYKTNLAIEGAGAKPTILPGGQGIYKSIKMKRAGNKASDLSGDFMTLAENLLRARTGAAAPDPEVTREYARTLLKGYMEDPKTWINKLRRTEEFVLGTAKQIRPKTWQQDLESDESIVFPQTNKPKLLSPNQNKIPNYNPATQKLQRNRMTGEIRVVPK